MRGGARVVRGGRPGFVDVTGAGVEEERGFVGGRVGATGFDKGGFGEIGFGGGECLFVGSKDVTSPEAEVLVRIFANFSANSFVRPS